MKHKPGDVIEYQPKNYFSKDRKFEWGKDLTPKQMKALRKGEVFVLLGEDGKPSKRILMDSYNQIRERDLNSPAKIDILIRGLKNERT
ncbi:MAG: hypothetical protein KAV87_50650 [Desulfobacteraceae bacterium]|nr:hypothetical protein [Desulfobacteraceae bacterium]